MILFTVDSDRDIVVLGIKVVVEFPTLLFSIVFLLDLLANFFIVGFRETAKNRKLLMLEMSI